MNSPVTRHRLPSIESYINREIGRRYRPTALIGEGAHARVYRAWDGVRQGYVALKIFNPSALDAQAAEAARHFEVLEGNAILPLLEVHPEFLEGEITVMRLMEGTLADGGVIFASEALHYTRRVLTALDFCHGRGVIHGDVKPSNVFLDDRGATYLGDFGIGDFMPNGQRGHTLEYAAPELLEGKPRSAQSDLWATAVMLYELLCRELPFGSRSDLADSDVAEQIATVNYRPPEHIQPYLPLRLRHLFNECFQSDPRARRYQSADALRLALPSAVIRAEWVQWLKEDFAAYWEGHEVAAGRRTGVRYAATVQERPRLGEWEAQIQRAPANGELRRWRGVIPFRGSRNEAFHRMALWMRNITSSGSP